MRQKILIALVTVVVALSAAAIGVATAGRTTESAQRYDHLSNNGVPVAVSERNANILRGGGGEPVLNRLGTRGGLTFYTGRGESGWPCYAVGPVETGGIAALACLGSPAQFPSADAPILDMSGIAGDPSTHSTTFLELSGFAADGVARVGVIGADSVLHDADVQDNIYYADLPRFQASALIAVDASGHEIFRRSLGSERPSRLPSAGSAEGSRDPFPPHDHPCHSDLSCPSDDGSYRWGAKAWLCVKATAYSREFAFTDKIRYGGLTYLCKR